MNLVEGESVTLISETAGFPPLELHYAETCIVPEAAGAYRICSTDGAPVKVILACVRN